MNHVSTILAGAEDPIDFLGGGIVAANGFGLFRCEPDFPSGKIETVRTAECAEVDLAERFLRDEVDDREGVERAAAVVGDVGGFAVGRGDDFVRVIADGDFGDDFKRRGIDDGESVIVFGED